MAFVFYYCVILFFVISSKFFIKNSTSSNVLKSPNVTLKAPLASSFGTPIADNTCDGAVSPDEHADPPDAHIPTASNFNSNSPEFILLKHKLQFPGSRCSRLPFILLFGNFCLI